MEKEKGILRGRSYSSVGSLCKYAFIPMLSLSLSLSPGCVRRASEVSDKKGGRTSNGYGRNVDRPRFDIAFTRQGCIFATYEFILIPLIWPFSVDRSIGHVARRVVLLESKSHRLDIAVIRLKHAVVDDRRSGCANLLEENLQTRA